MILWLQVLSASTSLVSKLLILQDLQKAENLVPNQIPGLIEVCWNRVKLTVFDWTRCGHAIESCGSELSWSALTATKSTTRAHEDRNSHCASMKVGPAESEQVFRACAPQVERSLKLQNRPGIVLFYDPNTTSSAYLGRMDTKYSRIADDW